MTQNGSAATFEHLLSKQAWSAPQTRLVLLRFDRRMLTAPWFRRASVSTEYEVVSWSEIREDELEEVRARQQLHGHIPDYLLPFENDGSPDTDISVGLRSPNGVIGWLLA